MTTQQPEALAQECADYATSLRSGANVANLKGRAPSVSFLRAADLLERAASRITELESQLAQRFDAADMATAAAQGVRWNDWLGVTAPEETDVNRIAIAEAGVRRCFARRHEGRYAFMPYEDAVRHCRKWIAALRDMRMEK